MARQESGIGWDKSADRTFDDPDVHNPARTVDKSRTVRAGGTDARAFPKFINYEKALDF